MSALCHQELCYNKPNMEGWAGFTLGLSEALSGLGAFSFESQWGLCSELMWVCLFTSSIFWMFNYSELLFTPLSHWNAEKIYKKCCSLCRVFSPPITTAHPPRRRPSLEMTKTRYPVTAAVHSASAFGPLCQDFVLLFLWTWSLLSICFYLL